jgi:DNA-binding transcriptional MerR regulator
MQENNLISIQEVSALLNVPKPTLRFWEKELEGILAPLRTDGGQRRYTVENIAVIEEIKKLKSKGMSLPEIKRKLGKGQRSEVRGQRSGRMSKAWGQMSEAGSPARKTAGRQTCPQRACLRGGRGSGDERTDRVDLLADRVAEVVKAEVNRFFEGVED